MASGFETGANNRLTKSPNGANQFTYSYDDEGNRITRGSTSSSDGSVQYQWDSRERLTQVTYKNSSGVTTKTVSYVYDTNNLRIAEFVDTNGDGTTDSSAWFVNDGQNVVFSHSQDAPPPVGPYYAVTHHYLHGSDVDQVFADETSSGAIQWALSDLNGSVRDVAVHNTSTNVTSIPTANHRVFDSFGNPTQSITDGFAYGYTGREYDAATSLQYNRDRWYDTRVGRFLSEDPTGFNAGDTNLSRYVFNDPTTNRDPSGDSWLSSAWHKVTHWVKKEVRDLGNFVENLGHKVEDALQDTGHWFEKEWKNGDIEKALLAVTAVVTAGMATPLLIGAGAGLLEAGAAGAWTGFVAAGAEGGVVSAAGAFSAF